MAHDNPFAATQVDDTPNFLGAWRDETFVVVSHNGVLPNRCVACNEPAVRFVQRRVGYNETTARNSPRSERSGRFLIAMILTLLIWLPGTYFSAQTVKQYPLTFGVTVVGSLLLAVWGVGHFFFGRLHEPVRFGLCTRHHVHRLLGNWITLAGLVGGLLSTVLFDFRRVLWVASLHDLQPGFICVSLFVVGMIIRAFHFHAFNPVLAKEDKEKRRWIQGFSSEFRDSLPVWQPTVDDLLITEGSPFLREPNEAPRPR